MTDSWDDRRKAQEDGYFDKVNKEALQRLAKRNAAQVRTCPVDGAAMGQVTVMGVLIDKCPDCGGVWLDSGELEQLLKDSTNTSGTVAGFFSKLLPK